MNKRGGEMGEMVVVRGDRRILSLVVVLPPSHTSNHPAPPTTPAATSQLRPIPHLPAAPIYSPILKGWSLIGQSVEEILKRYSRLRLTHGRKGLMNCDNVLPIYVGDDRTDEDAFKVSREGNRGYGIIVSSVPKESNAFYSVTDTAERKREGGARNLTEEERKGHREIKWDDKEVCGCYMIRFCPHDLFVNTRSDLDFQHLQRGHGWRIRQDGG
ncbi:hypothetical protein CASFOL_001705 [Castilleja foliolosa]|uniref:Trehalose-phosphatase n=1 Tax=Castilleja foliolosa TaxID=1961234 RepID=A0ABD3EG76_9LAMI